jgi:hypothetical protein
LGLVGAGVNPFGCFLFLVISAFAQNMFQILKILHLGSFKLWFFHGQQFHRIFKKKKSLLLLIVVMLFLLGLIRPAIIGKVGGTLTSRKIPESYLILENFLENKKGFFRTLWLPKKQRFGFYANNHPAIDSENFLTNTI